VVALDWRKPSGELHRDHRALHRVPIAGEAALHRDYWGNCSDLNRDLSQDYLDNYWGLNQADSMQASSPDRDLATDPAPANHHRRLDYDS